MSKNSMVIWKIGIQKCHSHSDKVQTTKKKKNSYRQQNNQIKATECDFKENNDKSKILWSHSKKTIVQYIQCFVNKTKNWWEFADKFRRFQFDIEINSLNWIESYQNINAIIVVHLQFDVQLFRFENALHKLYAIIGSTTVHCARVEQNKKHRFYRNWPRCVISVSNFSKHTSFGAYSQIQWTNRWAELKQIRLESLMRKRI